MAEVDYDVFVIDDIVRVGGAVKTDVDEADAQLQAAIEALSGTVGNVNDAAAAAQNTANEAASNATQALLQSATPLPISHMYGGTGSYNYSGLGAVLRQNSPLIYGTVTVTKDVVVYNDLIVMYGKINAAGALSCNFISTAGASSISWSGRAIMTSDIDGNLKVAPTTSTNRSSVQADFFTTRLAATTIASAGTIAPVNQNVFISGTAAISTITVPTAFNGLGGTVRLIPTGAFTTTTSGNIALASTAVVSRPLVMTYEPLTSKWYPSY